MSIEQQLLDYWQARFNVLTDAWRTGDNDAVLKATHEFIKANDSAPALVKLKTIAELQAENERLTTKVLETTAAWTDAQDRITALEADIASRQSWEASTRAKLLLIAGWLNKGNAPTMAARELTLTAEKPISQSQPQPLSDERNKCNECGCLYGSHNADCGTEQSPQRGKMPGECAPIWPPEPEKLTGEQS